MAQELKRITSDKIANSLEKCADYIKEHALELVGNIDNVREIIVSIEYEPFSIPTVNVRKEYIQPKAIIYDADYLNESETERNKAEK